MSITEYKITDSQKQNLESLEIIQYSSINDDEELREFLAAFSNGKNPGLDEYLYQEAGSEPNKTLTLPPITKSQV